VPTPSTPSTCTAKGDESAQLTAVGGAAQTADAAQPAGCGVRCLSDGCAVYASIEKTVRLPLPLFGQSVVVRGVAYAAPVVGATTAVQHNCVRGAWISANPATIP
jgi:hypothetical protein